MKDYVEIQARRKAHELVLTIFRGLGFRYSKNRIFEKLKVSVSNVPAELFEAHGRLFDDEKLKHISKARGHLYEVRYYLNLLADLKKISKFSTGQVMVKIELLDKLLTSMIRNGSSIRSRR